MYLAIYLLSLFLLGPAIFVAAILALFPVTPERHSMRMATGGAASLLVDAVDLLKAEDLTSPGSAHLALLCRRHHRMVHEEHLETRRVAERAPPQVRV